MLMKTLSRNTYKENVDTDDSLKFKYMQIVISIAVLRSYLSYVGIYIF